MQIQVATFQDLPAIAELVNAGYRGESSRAGWTTEADFFDGERTNPGSIAHDLAAAPGRLILMLRDIRELLGCVYLDTAHAPHTCYLGMLTVLPGTQARGLGRLLLGAAEVKAREAGAVRMRLCVLSPRTELMAWYERRGYQRTGEQKPFPYEKAEAEKPRRGDLKFIFFEKNI